MNVENLYKNLEQADTLEKLSDSFDNITKALNKSCNDVFQSLFDYKFSTFLYYHYIILNKTKREIAKEIKMHPSTIYYYIRKYKIKCDEVPAANDVTFAGYAGYYLKNIKMLKN